MPAATWCPQHLQTRLLRYKAAGEPLPSSYTTACNRKRSTVTPHVGVGSPGAFNMSIRPYILSAPALYRQSQQVWRVPAARACAAAHGDGVSHPDFKQREHAPALRDTSPGVSENTDRERTKCCYEQLGRMERAEAGASLADAARSGSPGKTCRNIVNLDHLARDSHRVAHNGNRAASSN